MARGWHSNIPNGPLMPNEPNWIRNDIQIGGPEHLLYLLKPTTNSRSLFRCIVANQIDIQ
ncbi:unnamed protein product [Lupinus luteus]|uniref:Uncharacterized protein n=1 Tax=Lupinus luteus TaxID=3873 RepID=A0AAV1X6H8_LUPLU